MSSTTQTRPVWQRRPCRGLARLGRSQADRSALPRVGRPLLPDRARPDGADAAAGHAAGRHDPRGQHLSGRADDARHPARLLRPRPGRDRARDVPHPAHDRRRRIAHAGPRGDLASGSSSSAGCAVVLSAFADGGASQAGWTGYPPLALTQEGNGVRPLADRGDPARRSRVSAPRSTSSRRSARRAHDGHDVAENCRSSPGRCTSGRG